MKIEYKGFFYLPDRRGLPTNQRFGYGGDAMCFNNGTLIVSGHRNAVLPNQSSLPNHLKLRGSLVSTISIPQDDRAEVIHNFIDPRESLRDTIYNYGLDRLGDIEIFNDELISVYYSYYGVQPINEIDYPTLSIGDGILYHIGPKAHPFNQKATSQYLFKDSEGNYYCGRGDGAGNASSPHGPAVFKLNINEPQNSILLHYISEKDKLSWWSPCDRWTGGAKIDKNFVFVGSKDTQKSPAWYGMATSDDGRHDPWNHNKGYHCEERKVVLLVYSEDFSQYEFLTLEEFHPASQVRGMTYDHESNRLFIWEHGPVENVGGFYVGENPKIHVYKVDKSKDTGRKITITIEGIGTFKGEVLEQ